MPPAASSSPSAVPWWACTILLASAIGLSTSSALNLPQDPAHGHLPKDSLIYAPSPHDYVTLQERACNLTSKRPKATRTELLAKFYANQSTLGSARLREHLKTYRPGGECRNEPSAWRHKYVDEVDGGVLVREDSIDERLANVVYTTRTNKGVACDSFLYDSGNRERDARNLELVAGPYVDDQICGQQLRQMLQLIRDLGDRLRLARASQAHRLALSDQHVSLARVLDTFGRYEAGFISGRLLAPGSHDHCQLATLVLNETSRTRMRFCWAHLSLRSHLADSLKRRPRAHFETPVDIISAGICVPRACHSKSFYALRREFQELVGGQFGLPGTMYVNETLPLDSIYCMPDSGGRFGVPLAGKALLCSLGLWLLAAICVTHKNSRSRARKSAPVDGRALWDCLDLHESWKDFMRARDSRDVSERAQLVELNTMNILKAIGCVYVILAHSMLTCWGFAQSELLTTRMMEANGFLLVMASGTIVVDTFVVISGILMSYFILKRLRKLDCKQAPVVEMQLAEQGQQFIDSAPGEGVQGQQGKGAANEPEVGRWSPTDGRAFFLAFWLKLTTLRYMRIVPLFVLFHWFKKYVYIYAGSGPLWDHGFNWRTPAGACRLEPAWVPFTFASAYLPLSHQCIGQSWSISNDMFFAILAPPIILLIHKRPRASILLTLVACLTSYLAGKMAFANVPAHLDENLRELRSYAFIRFFDTLSFLYTAPHYRVFCFLIGVWAGYYLHRYQEEADLSEGVKAQILWPNWVRGVGTKLAWAQVISVPVITAFRDFFMHLFDPLYRIVWPELYSSLRIFWSLANAILLLRLVTDWKDSSLGRFSASKFWQVFSKLNYAILLIHLDLLLLTIQISPAPPTQMTIWAFLNLASSTMLLCIPLSVFVFVVYENPIDKLTRALVAKNASL